MEMTCQQIAELVGGELVGDGAVTITGLEELALADASQLTFIGDVPHARRWPHCEAGASLINRGLEVEADGRPLIRVDDVDLAMAALLDHVTAPDPRVSVGVDPTASVDPSAKLGAGVAIGPGCVVGPNVTIGDDTQLHPRVTLYDGCVIGAGCVLWPNVVVRERCEVGDGGILHSGVVVGTDGFGYRPSPDGQGIVKIPHVGNVVLGRGVEVGANTTIDRGKFSSTTVGDGSKIDNLVVIAHNVRIGRCVLIAGKTGIAGSTTIGDGAMIGGGCDIRDHLDIGPGVKLAGGSQVMNDIPAGQTWAGSPAQEFTKARREYVAVRQLPDVMKKVRKQLRDMG